MAEGGKRELLEAVRPRCLKASKSRLGSRVRKRYDRVQTPYQRVLASPHIEQEAKE